MAKKKTMADERSLWFAAFLSAATLLLLLSLLRGSADSNAEDGSLPASPAPGSSHCGILSTSLRSRPGSENAEVKQLFAQNCDCRTLAAHFAVNDSTSDYQKQVRMNYDEAGCHRQIPQ